MSLNPHSNSTLQCCLDSGKKASEQSFFPCHVNRYCSDSIFKCILKIFMKLKDILTVGFQGLNPRLKFDIKSCLHQSRKSFWETFSIRHVNQHWSNKISIIWLFHAIICSWDHIYQSLDNRICIFYSQKIQ